MSNYKHTPGKWYEDEKGYIKSNNGEKELWQQEAIGQLFGNAAQRKYNGRLISAAPELLKNLDAVYLRLQILSNQHTHFAALTDEIRAMLRNQISIATGEDAETVQKNIEQKAKL